MLEVLDAAALRQWCSVSLERLGAARQEIDDLNVYPVPDGDTGTNLHLTMLSVQDAVQAAGSDLRATVGALVRGSLMGARGNSGVILSQLLRGLGDVVAELSDIGPEELKLALATSAKSAYAAVATPVEGTLLTVAREAAEGATGVDLVSVVRSARAAAEASLARTPDLLPQLKAAGVVDAGGRGWCVLLEALEQVVTGSVAVSALEGLPVAVVPRTSVTAARESGSDQFAYEVQFLLREATDESVAALKTALAALGDSLVVVGGDGLFNVHVHVNDIGAALEAGLDAGRPFRITVTRFEDQMTTATGRTVIAVAPGAGAARLFRDAGAQVVAGGPTSNPSTHELLTAIKASGAHEVVLLPNDGNVIEVARIALIEAESAGLAGAVIPTRSVVQGLAAVSVRDESLSLADEVEAMTRAATGTRWGEVTTAVRDSETGAGSCTAGDVLGLVGGTVTVIGRDVEQVAEEVLRSMLEGGGELVTLLLGAGADEQLGARLSAYLQAFAVEVLLLEGGQPHYPLLVGVE
jgi:DAK2 domain fusion protein YloV